MGLYFKKNNFELYFDDSLSFLENIPDFSDIR